MIDNVRIAALLEESRQAHQAYRDNVPRRIPAGSEKTAVVPGDAWAAGSALWQACRARTEAAALDPGREAAAWWDEPVTFDHHALMAFYAQQLTV